MSTILKALKQAERDCPDQENENRPSFNVRTVLSPQMQQKRSKLSSLGRAVTPLAVLLGVAIFSYSLFYINKHVQPQTSFTGEQSRVLDTKPDMVKGQEQIATLPAGESVDPPIPKNELVLIPEPVNQVPVSKALSKKVKEKDIAPLIAEGPTSGQSKIKDSVKEEKTLLKATSPKSIILPLENNNLKVQAISWDQSQANRIAVIDNSVLKEGDFVQGYRLVRIEKDSVILHFSGSDYRLGFRYR